MTVTYSSKVANASFFSFHRLLLRWKGSIYKLLYREFALFVVLYTLLSVIYRWSVCKDQLNVTYYQEKLASKYLPYKKKKKKNGWIMDAELLVFYFLLCLFCIFSKSDVKSMKSNRVL